MKTTTTNSAKPRRTRSGMFFVQFTDCSAVGFPTRSAAQAFAKSPGYRGSVTAVKRSFASGHLAGFHPRPTNQPTP